MDFDAVAVDGALATELLSEYVADRVASFPPSERGYTAPIPNPAQFTAPNGVFLVVREGGDILGCGGVRRLDDPELGAIDGEVRFEMKHVYLRPSARGRGAGRALLAALEAAATAFGATELVLDTNRVLVPANRLYESSGYERIPPFNQNPNATEWFRKRIARAASHATREPQ